MTSIEKLLIQGVRSFDPKESSVIDFYSPLTLIVGQNGAGKTTIIECLKYSCTGEMPPNCSSGQAFIHDTKIAGESEVKAQIKLRFKNPIGKPIVASRSLSLTQKTKNKQEYKQIDASLQSYTSEGQKVSKSFRCSDLDKEIPDLMGVAKPILKHVIFCHQEESNWPLSESSKLKLKFDEIFSAVKYTKALKSIKDKRKELTTTVKELKLQLETVGAHMENANRIKNDLNKMQDQFSVGSKQLDSIKLEMLEKQKQLQIIKNAELKLRELKNDTNVLNARKLEMEKVKNQIFNSLTEVFQESDEELVFMQSTFNDELEIMLQAEKELTDNSERLLNEKEFINQQLKSKSLELGGMKSQLDQQSQIINDRDKQMDEFIQRYKMNDFLKLSKPYTSDDANKLIEQIQSKYELLNNTIANFNKQFKNQLSQTTNKLNDKKVESNQIQLHCQSKSKQIQEIQLKIETIDKEIKERIESLDQLESLELEINQLSNELDQINKESQLTNQIELIESEKIENELQISKLSQSLKLLNLQLSSRTRLNIKRKECKQKQLQIKSKFQDNQTIIQILLNDFSINLDSINDDDDVNTDGNQFISNYLSNNLNLMDLCKKEINSINSLLNNKEIQEMELNKSKIEFKLNQSTNQLKNKKDELIEFKNKINQFISNLSIDKQFIKENQEIELVLNNLSNINGDGGNEGESEKLNQDIVKLNQLIKQLFESKEKLFILLESEDILYKEYIEKANDNKECSLCKTEMKEQSKLTSFVHNLECHRKDIPNQLSKLKIDIQDLKEQLKLIESILPIAQSRNEYIKQSIPILENEIQSSQNEKNQLVQTINQFKLKINENELKLKQFKSFLVVLEFTDSIRSTINSIQEEIEKEEFEIRKQSSDLRTIEEVEFELNEKQSKLKQLTNDINLLYEKKRKNESIQFEKQSKLVQLKNQLTEMKSSDGIINHLRDNKKEFMESIEKLQQEVKELSSTEKLQSIQDEIEQLEKEKLKQEQEFEKKIETFSKEKNVFSYRLESIKQLQSKVLVDSDQLREKIQQFESEIREFEEKIQLLTDDYSNGQQHITAIQQQLSSKDSTKRAISDNISYRQQLLNLEQISQQIIKKSELIKEMHQSQLEIDSSKMEQELNTLKSRFDQITGQVSILDNQISNYTKELSKQTYKSIDEQHKQLLIRLHTTETVGKDLDKYYKALDKALMKYHNLKMDEINRSIKEIWQTTYKGSDIDTIEIRSEETGTANKTINYRVVMIKGDVELDMRGRCSAGQKVLACLVIRLALAENFCTNCGILSLDEPTSHLDRANIESFANSLLNIIESRKSQKGFQLIIITHDEEFVQYLSRGNYTDYYWKVTKNANQHSNLERREIADL